jgi:hypothetical protein
MTCLERKVAMFRKIMFTTAILAGLASTVEAQPVPRLPFSPQSFPISASIEGPWFFRGDPFQPCSVQTVATPFGPRLIVTNEKGTSAGARLSRDGRRLTIPAWNLVGTLRGNSLVWPNGDFWSR